MVVLILFYLETSAFKFLNVSQETYGIFWPRRGWLYIHVVAGISAILLGPAQFWPGLKQKYPELHRVMGVVYVASAGAGGVSAIYLAFHTDFGWMFAFGLGSMATAWIISTGLATVAICRRMIEQHREWMVRSYVLTFGFVLLRVTSALLDVGNVGSISERFTFASWISWSVPLMITETLLQGRKVFAARSKANEAEFRRLEKFFSCYTAGNSHDPRPENPGKNEARLIDPKPGLDDHIADGPILAPLDHEHSSKAD
jgi:uncharacterized membrane protein